MIDLDRIKKVSKRMNMNLQDVALKAGLGKNTVYHWKNQNPTTDNITKVANVLNVSVDYLLGKTDNPSTSSKSKEVDIKDAMEDDYTVMSFGGRQIPPEELEMIRRILDGGK